MVIKVIDIIIIIIVKVRVILMIFVICFFFWVWCFVFSNVVFVVELIGFCIFFELGFKVVGFKSLFFILGFK